MTLSCKHCGNPSVIIIKAKCDDRCFIDYQGTKYEGYVPFGLGIGGGDYLTISFCHVCGTLFNAPKTTDEVKIALQGE